MKVVVVAVHPDDETLACGGTLLKHRSQGDEINWIITTGAMIPEIPVVRDMFAFNNTILMDLPETKLDQYPFGRIISLFSEIFNDIKPDIIYLPFKGDVHSDHQVIFRAAYSCTKSFRYPFIKKVLMMETISETDFAPALSENAFLPNLYVDITDYQERKKEILNVYSSELGVHPFPRTLENIDALAHWRGSQAGVNYAECFMILKLIQ